MTVKIRNVRKKLLVGLFGLTSLLFILLPQVASAAGEFYTYVENGSKILVGGGIASGNSATLNRQGTGDSFIGTITVLGDGGEPCYLQLLVTPSASGSTGTLFATGITQATATNDSVTYPSCSTSFAQSFTNDNQTINIGGSQTSDTAAPVVETAAQRKMVVAVYSQNDPSTLPAISVRATSGGIASGTNTSYSGLIAWGVGGAGSSYINDVSPGTYQVCLQPETALGYACKTATKKQGEQLSVNFGSSNLAYNEEGKLVHTVVEIDIPAHVGTIQYGPVTLSLQNADGSQVASVTTNNNPNGLDTGQAPAQTITIFGDFDDVEPGQYVVCIADTSLCTSEFTKEINRRKNVTISVSEADSSTLIYGEDNTANSCPISDSDPLPWIGCAIYSALKNVAVGSDGNGGVVGMLGSILYADPNVMFGEEAANAMSTFRNIAMVLVVLTGLIMVISQSLGFEFLDAYTIRKTLPRLAAALVGIALAWPLLSFLVAFVNDLGGLIYSVLAELGNTGGTGNVGFDTSLTQKVTGSFLTVGVVGTAGFVMATVMTMTGLLSLFATVVLGILIGLLVLAVRQLILFMAILLAPLAIAAYVFPGAQKLWGFWKNTLLTTLFMYPLIMGIIGAGALMSSIIGAAAAQAQDAQKAIMEIMSLVIFFVPFFMLPWAFKLAGGLMTTIFSIANDRNKGAFDRLKNYRANKTQESMASYKQGFDRSKIGTNLRARNARRLSTISAVGSGAAPGSRRYKSELENAELNHLASTAAESIKNNPSAAANDDANKIAQFAKNREDFITEYSNKMGVSREKAVEQLAYTEQSFGAIMGSNQMKNTAATAALTSSASTDKVGERADWAKRAVDSGLMSNSQAASLIKQSGTLASSAGFGEILGNLANDDRNAANKLLLTQASKGFNPANSHRMRKGQAQELAQEVFRQVEEAVSTKGTGSVEFAKAIADSAGIHDLMNGMTPDVREEFAKHLNSQAVATTTMRVREHEAYMEAAGNDDYLDRRKTWGSTAAGAAAGAPGAAPAAPAAGGAPGAPAGP